MSLALLGNSHGSGWGSLIGFCTQLTQRFSNCVTLLRFAVKPPPDFLVDVRQLSATCVRAAPPTVVSVAAQAAGVALQKRTVIDRSGHEPQGLPFGMEGLVIASQCFFAVALDANR